MKMQPPNQNYCL